MHALGPVVEVLEPATTATLGLNPKQVIVSKFALTRLAKILGPCFEKAYT
jgi:hypothetical protein